MPTVRPAPVVSLTVTRVVVTPGWGEAVRVVTWIVCGRDGDATPGRGAWMTIGTTTRD